MRMPFVVSSTSKTLSGLCALRVAQRYGLQAAPRGGAAHKRAKGKTRGKNRQNQATHRRTRQNQADWQRRQKEANRVKLRQRAARRETIRQKGEGRQTLANRGKWRQRRRHEATGGNKRQKEEKEAEGGRRANDKNKEGEHAKGGKGRQNDRRRQKEAGFLFCLFFPSVCPHPRLFAPISRCLLVVVSCCLLLLALLPSFASFGLFCLRSPPPPSVAMLFLPHCLIAR